MINIFWRLIARAVSRPTIATWLIERSKRTPYQHIKSVNGADLYMGRWWLLNPYDQDTHKPLLRWFPWSTRIHHIVQPDADRDPHDHPWNARTIILRGWYIEERLSLGYRMQFSEHIRRGGDTTRLNHGEFHRIEAVSPGGVFTLFITSRRKGDWGFLVNGVKVPWRKYMGEES